ncbi:acyl carrier protein [Gandjariella thermophila]|uniref:Carrier domain-containing protein n=1 Tax=Gandjariella thermophila TaxID=1931992 RepID=A0A4D4IZ52_9PSEU|nr:acyl carrier protein [Gandjariella thermophila]GDY29625.1 hypothetical protein GTS_12580 [Gandjariella thermophila]
MQSVSTVRDQVRSLVIDAAPVEVEQVAETTTLTDDLGYDSLSLLELVNMLENAFELPTVPDNEVAEITTVGAVQDLVLRMVEERRARTAG